VDAVVKEEKEKEDNKRKKLSTTKIKNFCAADNSIKIVKIRPQNRRKYLQRKYLI
jgi:hypothetical protein